MPMQLVFVLVHLVLVQSVPDAARAVSDCASNDDGHCDGTHSAAGDVLLARNLVVNKVKAKEEQDEEIEAEGKELGTAQANVDMEDELSPGPPFYDLVKTGNYCGGKDANAGYKHTLRNCAHAARRLGAQFFSYGEGAKKGKCYAEFTKQASCPEGWVSEVNYKFYSLKACSSFTTRIKCPSSCSWTGAACVSTCEEHACSAGFGKKPNVDALTNPSDSRCCQPCSSIVLSAAGTSNGKNKGKGKKQACPGTCSPGPTGCKAPMCPSNYPVCFTDGDCMIAACKNADCDWKEAPSPQTPPAGIYNYIGGDGRLGNGLINNLCTHDYTGPPATPAPNRGPCRRRRIGGQCD